MLIALLARLVHEVVSAAVVMVVNTMALSGLQVYLELLIPVAVVVVVAMAGVQLVMADQELLF